VATTQTELAQLPNHKLKIKKPGQRSCNEKDAKGKLCGGHLKRWYYMSDVKEQACGDVAKTLYLPNPQDPSGLSVAGQGQISTFGLTLPPKK
jgi:hypothetical protein